MTKQLRNSQFSIHFDEYNFARTVLLGVQYIIRLNFTCMGCLGVGSYHDSWQRHVK